MTLLADRGAELAPAPEPRTRAFRSPLRWLRGRVMLVVRRRRGGRPPTEGAAGRGGVAATGETARGKVAARRRVHRCSRTCACTRAAPRSFSVALVLAARPGDAVVRPLALRRHPYRQYRRITV